MGEQLLAMQLFAQLDHLTAQDERWFGQCLMSLGHCERAIEHYTRAIEMGCVEARIDMVRPLLVVHSQKDAEMALDSFDPEQLQGYNRPLWYRNASTVLVMKKDSEGSLQHAREAWRTIQGLAEFPFIAPKVLFELSDTYDHMGDAKLAIYYLDRADEISSYKYNISIKLSRIALYYKNGKYSLIVPLIKELLQKDEYSAFHHMADLYMGHIYRIRNQTDEAINSYKKVIALLQDDISKEMELQARVLLSSIYALQRRKIECFHEESRAKDLAISKVGDFHLSLRILYNDFALDRRTADDVVLDLMKIEGYCKEEGDIGLWLRAGMILSEIYCSAYPEKFSDKIEEVLMNITYYKFYYHMRSEWYYLPRSFAFVGEKYPNLMEEKNEKIKLVTIDREELLIENQAIALPFRKIVEIIAYLKYKNGARISEIVTDVFGEMEPDKGRNYFHQIKHQLNDKMDAVRIEFDKKSKKYILVADLPIHWDLESIIRENSTFKGIFLPSSGSDWVIELNQKLSE
ncbi:hypothetical protein GCM10008938_38830 [Deinococcus roseus]|uniref:MalT-like TPR region domain-containing protein n=2 Tax=Deinococcus roseus TaxID=392414 RepID=A0ABQ2D7S4_9DEIO|nr:hypothetical protein GCM10008938_38830 [Deinococcus roseus]